MTAPIAIHKPNRTQVSNGRVIIKYRQKAADTSGKTGPHGVRNGRGRSGSRRRNTMIPSATRTNANRVPMFVSSSTQPIGANAADTATNTPVMIVVMCGVLYFGCTRAAHGGSSPSRAMDMKMRDGLLPPWAARVHPKRSEEHTSELQSRLHLVFRLLLEKKKKDKHGLGIAASAAV